MEQICGGQATSNQLRADGEKSQGCRCPKQALWPVRTFGCTQITTRFGWRPLLRGRGTPLSDTTRTGPLRGRPTGTVLQTKTT